MPAPNNIQLIIADDQLLFLNGIRRCIERMEGVSVIAEASNGLELLPKIKALNPDMIVSKPLLPCTDWEAIMADIDFDRGRCKVIFIDDRFEVPVMRRLLKMGIAGYILKQSHESELYESIRTVMNGGVYYCKLLREKITALIRHKADKINEIVFSSQEVKVMKMICLQLTTKEIAFNLHLSIRTVEDHRHHILDKIGAKNVVGIALYAVKNRIIEIDDLK